MAIATYSLTALVAPDALALATFYAAIVDGEVVIAHRNAAGLPLWVELKIDGTTRIAFQRIENFIPPTWPEGPVPQQAHLDFDVIDLDSAEAEILSIGATKSEVQPSSNPQDIFRVYFDPIGHPFCLVKI
jgi:hypothetical protein